MQATTPPVLAKLPSVLRPSRLGAVATRPSTFLGLSLVVHLGLSWAMPASGASEPGPRKKNNQLVAFEVSKPEPEPPEPPPEPKPEPEPEPPPEPQPQPKEAEPKRLEPKPTPKTAKKPQPEPKQQLEETPEPEPEPDEPKSSPDTSASPDGAEQGAKPSVNSTEGGMAVGLAEGRGGGHGSGSRGDGSGSGVTAPASVADARALIRAYNRRVAKILRANHHYPRAARRMGKEGKVMLGITIDHEGVIRRVTIRRSSGHDVLDEAALEDVRNIDSVPPPSPKLVALGWDARTLTLPITYKLN